MKNWKTTLAGIILAASIGVATPGNGAPDKAQKWAGFASVIAAALLGALSKDNDVTGGQRKNE